MIENLTLNSNDNYVESLYETCQLEYELFLIESKAFNTLGKINETSIQESYNADIMILQESIKETLTIWLTRFGEALKKALDKFIATIQGAQDLAYLKSIEDSVKKLNQNPGFNVNNLRQYNEKTLQGVEIIPFRKVFDENKAALESQEKFLTTYYSQFFPNGGTDIRAGIEGALVKTLDQPIEINIERIKFYYNWCRNTYIQDIDAIKKQMDMYNTSTKSIQDIINQLPEDYRDKNQTQNNPNVTPTNAQQQEQQKNESYIYEAEGDSAVTGNKVNGPTNAATPGQDKSQNLGKMTFDDKVDYVGKASGTNQDTVNYIKNYLTCTTKILSALFIIVKNRKADYMRVLKHLFPMNREQKNTAVSTANITKTNNNVGQVDTSNMPTGNA